MVNHRTQRLAIALLMIGLLPGIAPQAIAQPDRIARVRSFTENGITVILSPADNKLIATIIALDGGIASGETTNPALGDFAADLIAASGSKQTPKEELRKFLARTSTTINGDGDQQGVRFSMTATRQNFGKAWNVLAGMITEPAFDPTAFGTIMGARTARERRRNTNPGSYAERIADSLLMLGHPVLGRRTQLADIEAVSVPMIEAFQRQLAQRSRMTVVVVGNVSEGELRAKLRSFAGLPVGNYTAPVLQPLAPAASPKVLVSDRPGSPTTYVSAAFAGPPVRSPEYWPLAIGLAHLRNVLFQEVRTKRNLSYAPGSHLSSPLGIGVGSMSVSSVYPDSAIEVMNRELQKMRQGEFTEEDLNDSRQVYITGYFMRQMTNGGVAEALLNAHRSTGDWKTAFSYDAIQQVTKASVQAAFQKYARNLQVGIVGPKSGVTEKKYVMGS
ncbi:MAG: insulinase family protein [Candidatus Kapabacteria bacterium]|nr:MAG: processing peptidase [Chlorobi bacterium OLB7]MBX7216900.1 insulinase family protein [Candidatus Kapabacteria bacterium]